MMGRWIEYTKVIIPEPYNEWEQAWKCSECGFDDGFVFYNYCPNCGARMEPEEEDKGGKLIKSSDAAEALSEKLNIPMADLVDLFAEIPGVTVDRLQSLARADGDGRLVVLPCKVGDTVYFTLLGRIIEKPVFSIVSFSTSARIYCAGTSEYFRPEDFGKTVFLTRKEAEASMKGGDAG